MFLNCPLQTLDVSFRVKHGGGHDMLYASTRSMRCFDCGDVGHKLVLTMPLISAPTAVCDVRRRAAASNSTCL